MNRAKTIALAVATVFVLASTTASAKDMGGKFGVGYEQNLTGSAGGLNVQYWFGNLSLGMLLGLDYFKPDSGDSTMTFNLAPHVLYAVARSNEANLNMGIRLPIGIMDPGAGDTQFGLQIELPIVGEYFFSDHFAIFGQVGLVFELPVGDQNVLSGRAKGFGVGIGGAAFSGGAGFNFYF